MIAVCGVWSFHPSPVPGLTEHVKMYAGQCMHIVRGGKPAFKTPRSDGVNNNSNSKTMFMVLSSWQSHCESSPGEFDQCKTAPSGRQSKTKPDNLGCESACTGARVYTQHRHPIVLCQHWLVHTVGTGRADESITQAAVEAWLRVVFSSLLRCFCTTCSGD